MIGVLGYGGAAAAWQRIQYAPGLAHGVSAAPAASEQGGAPVAASAAATAGAAVSAALAPSELPYVPQGYGPEELATRARIQFPGLGAPSSGEEDADKAFGTGKEDEEKEGVPGVEDAKSPAEVTEDAKCETCEKRKYKDGSDDPGVSFKNAQRVDPRMAQAAVRGHEMEHVVRERAKAAREGRKVVSQSVTYHTGICPECGKFYVSGGTTRTVTAEDNSDEYLDELFGLKDKGFDITA